MAQKQKWEPARGEAGDTGEDSRRGKWSEQVIMMHMHEDAIPKFTALYADSKINFKKQYKIWVLKTKKEMERN